MAKIQLGRSIEGYDITVVAFKTLRPPVTSGSNNLDK